ncbi:MAG: hypothetical protein ABIQ03_10215 [Burkholderiales bacterium]
MQSCQCDPFGKDLGIKLGRGTVRAAATPLHLLAATPRFDRPANALHPVPPELIDALWEEVRAHDAAW